jgi:hypothetical protein
MTTIPLAEALRLLDLAHDIRVPGYSEPKSFSLDTAEGAYSFLELTLEEGDNEFFFRFLGSANQTVKVAGDIMTLIYDDAVGTTPEIEIRLMVPMVIETPPTPPLVLKALRHVRAHIPEVDRVVFWGDDRWAFMTEGHEVPSFHGRRIDIGLLKDAANSVDGGYAFRLNPATL